MPGGRPVEWTPERKAAIQEYILEQLAIGRSLVSICKEPDTPSYVLVSTWRNEDEEFFKKYMRARDDQADYIADEISDIADNATDANLARLQIDARKWKAGKLKPKVYGDRINIDADVNLTVSDEQVESRVAQLLRKAGASGSPGGEGEA